MAVLVIFAIVLVHNILNVSSIMRDIHEHGVEVPYSLQQLESMSKTQINPNPPVNNTNTPTNPPSNPTENSTNTVPATHETSAPVHENHGSAERNEAKSAEKPHVEAEVSSNVVLAPTVGNVSQKNEELMNSMEKGVKHIRNVLMVLSVLEQLLDQDDKTSKFTVEGEDYTFSMTMDIINKLIADGEKAQRIIIHLGPLILAKLATPKNNPEVNTVK